MKKVYEANNALEGHMIANLLEQANIYARVDGDFLQGGVGELQAFGIVKVMVNDDDYKAARELVIEWDAAQMSDASRDRKQLTYLHLLLSFIVGLVLGAILVA